MKHIKSYNIAFISTFIEKKNIDNLVETVIKNNHALSILFVIVNQTNEELEFSESSLINFHQIKTSRLSLSKARNVGINYLVQNEIQFEHIMFPDDDTTFSDIFFLRYKEYIKVGENYLIDVYCADSQELFKKNKYKDGDILRQNNYEAAMSVNMVIDYKIFKHVGLFDERIGVGAKYGAGEDSDYFIRACNYATQGFIYTKTLFNFHPSSVNKFSKMKTKQVVSRYVNYGNGVIFMLCKHNMYREGIKISFRALGGALVSCFKLDLKLFIAYFIAFFSRLFMFIKCNIYSN